MTDTTRYLELATEADQRITACAGIPGALCSRLAVAVRDLSQRRLWLREESDNRAELAGKYKDERDEARAQLQAEREEKFPKSILDNLRDMRAERDEARAQRDRLATALRYIDKIGCGCPDCCDTRITAAGALLAELGAKRGE